jgi:UDP-N-acetylmuramyl pentapeptide phosphotransferase/UDP-N-acetylglucosamine-1-phosphate transferase
MGPLYVILVLTGAAIVSAVGIEMFRRNSLKRQWVDVPNERSSHDRPTPRGAGLVIALISLSAYCLIGIWYPTFFFWGYLGGAALIAVVSWLDDLYSIPFFVRLIAHFAAALAVVVDVGIAPLMLQTGRFSPEAANVCFALAVLWIVWVINLYNFMDGIDGIAGLQALVAAAFWAFLSSGSGGTFLFEIVITGACLGFLFHNWHPARVFLGDVGSAFLGFTFAVSPLLLMNESRGFSAALSIAGLFVLWPFVFDATWTLLVRALNGERFWRPHRKHLYQRLVISGYSHSFVAAFYGLFAVMSAAAALVFMSGTSAFGMVPLVLIGIFSCIFAAVIWFRSRSLAAMRSHP